MTVSVEPRPTHPPTPVRDLTMRAFNPDGSTRDPDAVAQVNAILDADLFLGPTVQVATR